MLGAQRALGVSPLVFRKVWRVTHELPDSEETVLFDSATSQLLMLSDTGAAVWYLIDGVRTEGDIVDFIRSERPDAPPTLEREVGDFLADLLQRGAIEASVTAACE